MTAHKSNEHEQDLANQAWEQMQKRLRQEPVNPAWATWQERQMKPLHPTLQVMEPSIPSKQTNLYTDPKLASTNQMEENEMKGRSPMMKTKRKRNIRLACASAVAAITIIAVTPAGNEALAGILNKFTMQDAVLVQTSEMDNMVQIVRGSGESYESANQYGSFHSIAMNNFDPDASAEQIRDSLGYTKMVSPNGEPVVLSASIGSQTEMKLHVNEVNETLKRLGADHLFPAEADGKAITLTYADSIYYNFQNEGDHLAVLEQSKMPSVEFDSSFPVETTMDAVINFPYLPQDLRSALQKTAVSSGTLPLPIYLEGQAQALDVQGTKVTYTFSDDHRMWSAFWMKNGELLQFSASTQFLQDEAEFLDFVKGLAAQ